MRIKKRSVLLALVLCGVCGYFLVFKLSRDSDSTDKLKLKRDLQGETAASLRKWDAPRDARWDVEEKEEGAPKAKGGEEPDIAKADQHQEVPGPRVPEGDPTDINPVTAAEPSEEPSRTRTSPLVNYCLHAFYYPWYGAPKTDGKYVHWNHPFIPHWNKAVAKKFPQGIHSPPDDIGASYYPQLGPYSSSDPEIIEAHMQQLMAAKIGVLVVSWYPPNKGDDNGVPFDGLIPTLLDYADNYSLKVALHIEPYKGRSAASVLEDIKYIYRQYAHHSAYLKYGMNGNDPLPVLYIYDSYLVNDWGDIFTRGGIMSVRGTKLDVVAISLLVGRDHEKFVVNSGFDGFYTYFGADRFSYGSTQANWKRLADFARLNNLLFVPSVAPGYDDTQVRPWNKETTRNRANGYYYSRSIFSALDAEPKIVSITSFNEWHEGTQIETAVPKHTAQFVYKDYTPNTPDHYLTLTRERFKNFLCNTYE